MNCTRRDFVKYGALTSAGVMLTSIPALAQRLDAGARLRIGYIGLGAAGKAHLKAGLAKGVIQFAALYDTSAAALQSATALCRNKSVAAVFFASAEELLLGTSLDLVVVATPNASHREIAEAVVKANVPVLLETMPISSVTELQALQKAVAHRSSLISVATPWRLEPSARQAHEWVRDGRIGKLLGAQICCSGRTLLPDEFRKDELMTKEASRPFGDTLFSGIGFAYLDLFFWITGCRGPATAFCCGSEGAKGTRNRGTRTLIAGVKFDSGPEITLDYRFNKVDDASQSLLLRGSEGTLLIGTSGKATWVDSRGKTLRFQTDKEATIRKFWAGIPVWLKASNGESYCSLDSSSPPTFASLAILSALERKTIARFYA